MFSCPPTICVKTANGERTVTDDDENILLYLKLFIIKWYKVLFIDYGYEIMRLLCKNCIGLGFVSIGYIQASNIQDGFIHMWKILTVSSFVN